MIEIYNIYPCSIIVQNQNDRSYKSASILNKCVLYTIGIINKGTLSYLWSCLPGKPSNEHLPRVVWDLVIVLKGRYWRQEVGRVQVRDVRCEAHFK